MNPVFCEPYELEKKTKIKIMIFEMQMYIGDNYTYF